MPTSNNITVSYTGEAVGTKTLSVSGTSNTGRNSRTAVFTLAGTGSYSSVTSSNSLSVSQSGLSGYLSVTTSSSTTAFPSSGGNITYSGTSNLASIKIGTGSLDSLLTSAIINGVTVSKDALQNGYTVPNDPGANAEYNVTFVYSIPENTSPTKTVTYSGTVGGQSLSVIQSSASYSLAFSSSHAQLDSNGMLTSPSSVSVNATSGLTWKIDVE